jgi:threonine dehydratase
MSLITFANVPAINATEVRSAAARIGGLVRAVDLIPAETGGHEQTSLYLANECGQYTGSFKARGAANLVAFHRGNGSMPDAGVTIADGRGGNAALACAWAAQKTDTSATVFLPERPPAPLVRRLREAGAAVVIAGGGYPAAFAAAKAHARATGAVFSHRHDHPLIAAGAGTVASEVSTLLRGDFDSIVVPVGGGALLAGTCAALEHTGIKVVAAERASVGALGSALAAGQPVDAPAAGADDGSLTPRRISQTALDLAEAARCVVATVSDEDVAHARRAAWRRWRLAVEPAAAMALAAVLYGSYIPEVFERVVVVLSGANTNPADLPLD